MGYICDNHSNATLWNLECCENYVLFILLLWVLDLWFYACFFEFVCVWMGIGSLVHEASLYRVRVLGEFCIFLEYVLAITLARSFDSLAYNLDVLCV